MQIDKGRFLLLTTAIATVVFACDSHPANEHGATADGGAHSSPYPACDAIIKACHAKDVGAGPVNDCHSVAHDATGDDVCIPKKDACLKTCAEAVVDGSDAGTSPDASDGG